MQPANGAVFALDGILIGAGDTRFLMWACSQPRSGVFVPIALAPLALDLGIIGVWVGLVALIAGAGSRPAGWRFRGGRWAVTGARRARGVTA